MFQVAKFAALVLAATSVSALVAPRVTPPVGWSTGYLEDYDTYHSRYLALDCHSKHGTPFFDMCCHPLLATENLSTHRPESCNPSTSHAPQQGHSSTDDDDEEDCDWEEDADEEESSRVAILAGPSHSEAARAAVPPLVSAPASTNGTALESASVPPAHEKSSATVYTGGYATYFYQNGVAGACGKVHSDSDMIAAIDGDRYGNPGVVSPQCNKQVRITNTDNGKSVTVTIADSCPTCTNSNSIDLAEGAFKKIATLSKGMVPITWSYV